MRRVGFASTWLLLLIAMACKEAVVAPMTTLQGHTLVGRFDLRDPAAPRCAWPGSQIRARFSGPWIRATLTDTACEGDQRENDWIEVIVDDAAPRTFKLSEGQHVYPLAKDLGPGEHEITIWKRTEAAVGTITFHGFEVAAGQRVSKAAQSSRQIEVVGDSISAGYGNEGTNPYCGWSAARENNFLTYGAFAARALNASYTAIAWSGKGVVRNNDPREPLTLPQLYLRVIPTEDDSPVATATPVPDVYVVNLGTNDMFSGAVDQETFVREYLAFLGVLRARAPQALLVLVLGPMLVDEPPQSMQRTVMRTWLAQIEQQWRGTIDDRIASIEVWTDPAEGSGCNFHPNVKTHKRIGNELATLLRDRLGW